MRYFKISSAFRFMGHDEGEIVEDLIFVIYFGFFFKSYMTGGCLAGLVSRACNS